MGHEQHSLLAVAPDPQQQLLHLQTRLAIECTEGLIHEQDLRIVGQRPSNRHTLHHAAGQLLGVVVGKPGQADFIDVVIDDLLALSGCHTATLEAELDVLPHRQPGEQRVALEHHAAIRTRPLNLLATDVDFAFRGLIQSGGEVQQTRLAAPRRPDQYGKLLIWHFKRHLIQRGKHATVGLLIAKADLVHLQPWRGVYRRGLWRDETRVDGAY